MPVFISMVSQSSTKLVYSLLEGESIKGKAKGGPAKRIDALEKNVKGRFWGADIISGTSSALQPGQCSYVILGSLPHRLGYPLMSVACAHGCTIRSMSLLGPPDPHDMFLPPSLMGSDLSRAAVWKQFIRNQNSAIIKRIIWFDEKRGYFPSK